MPVLRYCGRLDGAVERFGSDYATFEADTVYQDSCSLCIIQIGEAVNRLSDEFVAAHSEVDWRRIKCILLWLKRGQQVPAFQLCVLFNSG